MKHIREAIRHAGIPSGDVRVQPGKSHIRLYVGPRFIVASCSPKDANTAAVRIARDLKKIFTH